ncbi:MAG TPA: CBS domain-containing protein [Thiobacillaceae bacterium]|nr:CBS domain-containing protein [Thiobacillaceae bacterium]
MNARDFARSINISVVDVLKSFARRFLLAETPPLSRAERWRSMIGALAGMGICGLMLHAMPVGSHWLIAPVGASAVILYALSHSPLAQPWPVIGSYLVAAVMGLASATFIPIPQLAAAVAVAASIWLAARLNCIHPPGGAVALFIVLDGPYTMARMGVTLGLVMLNVAVMLFAALLVNNLLLGRRYPFSQQYHIAGLHQTKDAPPLARIGLDHADLESAVQALDTFVDVQEDELVQLYNLAVDHAFDRHIGLSCGDIMSRDVVTVQFGTELEEAWSRLRAHKIKALPVVDMFGRLLGILTVADYLRQMDATSAAGLAVRLQYLLRRTPGMNSEKAEVAGQIMSSEVYAVRTDTPISELVHHMSEQGLHHIPVLNDKRRVVGMVTHTDIIAALYKRIALSTA